MKRWLVFVFALFVFSAVYTQNYPVGYFRLPLDTNVYLSANFGAVRGNHFHSGIDIKTFSREGLPVIAAADGYIARIKISPYGYGKALYIDHPNGYTTVYGHLQTLNESLNTYTQGVQYKQKSFAIDDFPAKNILSVKKGDTIAFSGNSGGSTGPHLHFEIRHTKSEETIDPVLFGIDINDQGRPSFSSSFLIYEKNDDFKHQHGHYPYAEVKHNNSDTVKVRPGQYAFAAWADDYVNRESNEVGINYLQLYDGENKLFDCGITRFSFDDTRMVNCHIDYTQYHAHSRKWHKMYVEDGNSLNFYNGGKKEFVTINEGEVRTISFITFDLAGYSDTFSFLLMGDTSQMPFMPLHPKSKEAKDFAYPGSTTNIKKAEYSFTIPKWAMYDTAIITTKITKHKRKDLYAGYISVMNPAFPLHKSFTISIKPTIAKGIDPKKLVVVRLTGRNLKNKISEGGSYRDGQITATSKSFGIFSVAVDNVKPTIDNYKQTDSLITVRINDNLSGVDTYDAYIDTEWWLMEYDAKNDLLSGILPKNLATGKHEITIVVTDERKNSNTFTKTIEK